MRCSRAIGRGALMVLLGVGVVTVFAGSLEAQPKVKIKVVRNAGFTDCTTAGSCSISVRENRGLGVCKQARIAGSSTYCSATFKFQLKNKSKLTAQHELRIERNANSTAHASCLDKASYLATKAAPVATAVVQNVGGCLPKTVWFYDAILVYVDAGGNDVIIDRKDPGVIIDN